MTAPHATRARTDIQALRGLAVTLVVLYHAGVGNVRAGYLGVDIFFVISGFLITTLVASGIRAGTFTLGGFYWRRAKRLLPAAYVTILCSCIAAWWFLDQAQLREFAMQVVGAVTFSANIVLLHQTGYFESASTLKPFLHMWSLAIEEQFYLLLPATLLLVPRKRWLGAAAAVMLLSLGAAVIWNRSDPSATFYLLPTRAWELLIGGVGALWLLRSSGEAQEVVSRGSWVVALWLPALACLLIVPWMPFGGQFAVLNELLVCVATLVVLLRNAPVLNASAPAKALARVGDFSYSLYLVHWPVMAFINNAWFGDTPELPLQTRLIALGLSFALGYLLYKAVEDPLRRRSIPFSRPMLARVIACSMLLATLTPIAIRVTHSPLNFRSLRRINFGFGAACESHTLFAPSTACESSATPDVLVWGDSYAMHIVPGIVQTWHGKGVVQATRSECGPLLGLAPRATSADAAGAMEYDRHWAEECIRFNRSVLEYLRATPGIQYVVLSSPFAVYLPGDGFAAVAQAGSGFAEQPATHATAVAALRSTVAAIRGAGRKVVVVAPPPSSGFDIGACLERHLTNKITLGAPADCEVNRATYLARRAGVLELLDAVSKESAVSIIRFDSALCDSKTCKTMLNGTMLYRDAGHLSVAGSVAVAERMGLGSVIRREAR